MFDWNSTDVIFLPIALLILIGITLVLYGTLRDKSKDIRKIPLYVITAIILVLEVAKQIYYIVIGYSFWALPLHFCSLFLYAFPLMLWAKGRLQYCGNSVALISTSMLLICFYLSPDSILGPSATANFFKEFLYFHTIVYHHLALLFLFVGLSLDLFDFDISNLVYFWISFAFYSVIVVIFANILHTNFINLLENVIPILEKLRQEFGMAIYTVVMFLVGSGGGGLVFIIERSIYMRINQSY